MLGRLIPKAVTSVSRSVLVRHSFAVRPFMSTALTRGQGQVDHELSHLLKKELNYEQENLKDEKETKSDILKEFTKQGTFQVVDVAGEKEVKLVRTFGNEKITVFVSTDALVENDRMIEDEEDEVASYPISMTVLIQKKDAAKDNGTMELSVTLDDGAFFIENVAFDKSSQLMTEETAEADWKRRGLYGGPVFGELDEQLQETFLQYLEERGFDDALAGFIPEYLEKKEQGEYIRWLETVGNFVSK